MMLMRVCNGCLLEKPFIKGSWSSVRGMPTGRLCLACKAKRTKIWQDGNRAKARSFSNSWKLRNKDKALGLTAAWKKENPGKHCAGNRKYDASKLQRTPAWLTAYDFEVMEFIYNLAAFIEKQTGMPYHIDHIAPLQGTVVSGLHVPLNLQILTATNNLSKGNRHG